MKMKTRAAVLLLLFLASAVTAEAALRVGAAKVDVTPGEPVAPATGKYDHERLYIRAIVLDNGTNRGALVSMDAGRLTPAGLELLTGELDVPEGNIIVSSTHTHSSSARGVTPGGRRAQQQAEGPQPPTEDDRNVLRAVREARAVLQPAAVGFGEGLSYLNVNRDAIDPATGKWHQGTNPDGPSDKTVAVLTFRKPGGQPIAAYVNYAMHPINGYVSGVVSADVPGAMSRYVEKAFRDDIVVAFTQGASGDQNPLYLRPSTNVMASRNGTEISGYVMDRESSEALLRPNAGLAGKPADPVVMDNLLRFIESQGQLLGEEVIRVMTLTNDMEDDVAIVGLATDLSCPGRVRISGDAWDNATREGVSAEYEDGPDVPIHVGVLRIGNIALASSSGELYTRIGQRVKQASPLEDTMLVTLIRPYRGNGYTPDDLSYGHQTFQALAARTKQGCAEQSIAEGIRGLVADSLKGVH
jgi:hypothetical protein